MEFHDTFHLVFSCFLYRLCYVVIYGIVLLYYFTSVYSSFLLYLVWVFCLIRLALCCSLKLFWLAQKKCVPLSSIRLDVAAKQKKQKKKERERERENKRWNKLRTLLYSCNIIFCWRNSYPPALSLSLHLLKINQFAYFFLSAQQPPPGGPEPPHSWGF